MMLNKNSVVLDACVDPTCPTCCRPELEAAAERAEQAARAEREGGWVPCLFSFETPRRTCEHRVCKLSHKARGKETD